MFLLNGQPVSIDNEITIDGVRYPNLRNPEIREQLGVVEAPDPEWYDERFYWGHNNPKQLDDITVTPETITYPNQTTVVTETPGEVVEIVSGASAEPSISLVTGEPILTTETVLGEPVITYGEPYTQKGLKSQWISQVKDTAGKLLAQTDWMVTRQIERQIEIPVEIATKRLTIVQECDRLEAAIQSCTTVEELINVVTNQEWPS